MRRRVLVALLAVLPLAVVAPAHAQPAQPVVVVIGVAGLGWEDVTTEQTPVLARLAERAAVGVLSVKAAGPVTCAADGWLTLGAGNRADAFGADAAPCSGSLPVPEGLPSLQERLDEGREGTELGALGRAVSRAGRCVSASGPGAELAVPAGDGPGPCGVHLVDAGSTADLPAVDAVVARAAASRGPGSTLLVVGVSLGPGEQTPRLHVALADGPGFATGALVSASTRRAPYVQLVDVAPTVLALLDLPQPDEMTGEPWRSQGEAPTVGELRDLALRATVSKGATVPFFVVLVGVLLLAVGLAGWRRRPRLAELAGLGATAALGASYVANLVPWWRAGLPLLALLAVAAALSALVVGLALRVPGRLGPAGAVCGALAAVLCLDLVAGAPLQMDAVAGYSPLVAGRFAGIGNVAFGVLAASALLGAAALAAGRTPRRTAAAVALVGLVVVVVDGAPPWGSDVGGVLALVPAFTLLALLRTGRRITLGRLLAAALAGVAVVTVFALADFARPAASRTHLGRFVQDVADGSAGTLLRRKAEAVLGLLFSSPVTALLPVVVALAVYLVLRPPAPLRAAFAAAPAWRHGLLAVGLASAVGFAVNDSGAAVPALALLVAGPATVAVVARVSSTVGSTGR